MKNKATIKDVAAMAGVSVATVSRWIHSNGYVSESNAAKISDAIKRLGYQTKHTDKPEHSAKSNLIAVIGGSSKEHTYLPRLTYALSIASNEAGYYTMYIARRPNNNNIQDIIQTALAKRVSGIIITDFEDLSITHQNKYFLMKCGVPVVILERAVCAELNSVHIDTTHGVYMATKHLIENGRKNLLYLSTSLDGGVERDRLAGFQNAVKECSAEDLKYEIQICESSKREACTSALEKVYNSIFIPDGIVCWSDIYAITTLQFLYKRQINVPDEVAVVGYDDFLSSYTTPPLTTVRAPLNEMACAAVEIIIDNQSSDRDFYARTITVTPKLVVREST